MKGGYYRMFRGWMDNPMFKDEPYTEREAWVWLIENAAWKDERKRVNACTVEIRRGQVAASLRFMAAAWQWNEPRVRRYLARLTTDAAIDAASDAGVNVITICNYDKYQVVAKECDAANDAAFDAQPTQQTTQQTTQTKRKKDNKDTPPTPLPGGVEGKPSARREKGERVYTAEEDAGIRAVKDAYPQRAGQQGWKDANRRMADIVASGRATWDDLLRITRAHAQQAAKAGKVGTDKVPMASTYFGEQKGYWSEDLEKLKPSAPSNVNDIYRKALTDYRNGKTWDLVFGPPPRAPGCDIPPELINEILGAPKLTVVATA